jgi:hypothetical protein
MIRLSQEAALVAILNVKELIQKASISLADEGQG